jgi:hypothetical protein
MEGWHMTKNDWDFIKDLLDALLFRFGEQERRIQHLEQQMQELLKDKVK